MAIILTLRKHKWYFYKR